MEIFKKQLKSRIFLFKYLPSESTHLFGYVHPMWTPLYRAALSRELCNDRNVLDLHSSMIVAVLMQLLNVLKCG